MTLGDVLAVASAVSGSRAEIAWLDREAIVRTGLEEWKEIPLWMHDARFMDLFHSVRVDRAIAAGLQLRPLEETVRDTLAWARQASPDRPLPYGMTAEREAAALGTIEGAAG